ncbi:MAG: hypothetical protein GEV07_24940 [Streptosporangiales bacterium]|nr:hypothetical protein [Streptosporangiales bacterium]
MTRPIQPGDPAAFGPFHVDARLADSPSGVVFLGSDEEGRRAAIATLTGPAAEDPAMQARFREVADPAELYDAGDGARVLAANLDGGRPWVATTYDGVHPGAERVLEELSSNNATARYFQPFTQYPAHAGFTPGERRRSLRPKRPWWWWVVVTIVLLGLLILMLLLFARCGGGGDPDPSQSPSSGSGSPSQSTSQSQTPSSSSSGSQSSSGSNSPSQSSSGQSPSSGSPTTSGTGSGSPSGTGTGEPTGAPLHPPLPTR